MLKVLHSKNNVDSLYVKKKKKKKKKKKEKWVPSIEDCVDTAIQRLKDYTKNGKKNSYMDITMQRNIKRNLIAPNRSLE